MKRWRRNAINQMELVMTTAADVERAILHRGIKSKVLMFDSSCIVWIGPHSFGMDIDHGKPWGNFLSELDAALEKFKQEVNDVHRSGNTPTKDV